jgi:hypothetical protein
LLPSHDIGLILGAKAPRSICVAAFGPVGGAVGPRRFAVMPDQHLV